MPITVSIRWNRIPQVQASICDNAEDGVRDSAHYMQQYASSIAPHRTGAFAASLYVNGPRAETDYAEHVAMAKERNAKANIVPELRAAIVDPKLGQLRDLQTGRFTFPQAICSSAVEYGLYLEEGTVHMSPRPTLRPAALATEQQFRTAMRQVADGF